MKNTIFLIIGLLGVSSIAYAAVPQGNCDGINGVDSLDVTCTINDLQNPQASVDSDCTEDGNENSLDVACVTNIILGMTPPNLVDANDMITLVESIIIPITLVNTGGVATSCAVNPVLPAGLTVTVAANGLDCEITGTPTVVAAFTPYTVTVTNATGNSSAIANITIIFKKILNDTGITWGANYPIGHNATCIGETIGAQDCSHGRDALDAAGALFKIGAGAGGLDFTKLDSNGDDLAVSAISWSCVRDNHTGLVWEVKTTNGSIHDKNNTYRWGGKTALGRNHPNREGDYYDDWNTLVDGSNGANFCGFNDWRVPSRESLQSIMIHGRQLPTIDTDYFPNVPDIFVGGNPRFWSSRPLALGGIMASAWELNFSLGGSEAGDRYTLSGVRLVRGGAAP